MTRHDPISEIARLTAALEAEKVRRVYYQDIVYAVCIELDRAFGKRVRRGEGIVCGTSEEPSTQVQAAMKELVDRDIQRSKDFAAAQIGDTPCPVNLLTREDVKRILPKLPGNIVDHLIESSNKDSNEGVEWLPFYKCALTLLMQVCAELRPVVCVRNPRTVPAVFTAAELYHDHLLMCGIGPLTGTEQAFRCHMLAEDAKQQFINPK
jgi:hypothetical protein